MKQLTKEQHFEVFTWLVKTAGCTLAKQFEQDFEPSCCDSCADGEHCDSEPLKETSQLIKLKKLEEFFRRIK